RPRVEAYLPGRPVTVDRTLQILLDLGIRHAVKVVVGAVVPPDVLRAERIELTIPTAADGRPVAARLGAALPLAARPLMLRIPLLRPRAVDANHVEIFRVELHGAGV